LRSTNLLITRWHKVVERVNTALKERETSVKKAFTATTSRSITSRPTKAL
jgi:hypothetical protein